MTGSAPVDALLIVGAEQIATLAGGVRRGAAQEELALLVDQPAVAVAGDRIVATGREHDVRQALEDRGFEPDRVRTVDAAGGVVTPGLIDPHTHLLFSGTREGELRLRQQGAGYLEILAAGGGILSTVARTRAARDEELLSAGRRWLREMLSHGVTTLEVKSGYGLDTATELRLLALAGQLASEGPLELVPTFLGAHAVPADSRGRPRGNEEYVHNVIEEQLPAVAGQGIARFCDVFCEMGVFDADQSRAILDAGRRHGLGPRLHADELHPSGGAELAAEIGAASADHLAAVSETGIAALADAAQRGTAVVATLLPATTFFLMSDSYAPARSLIDAGVPIALGSDFNPGTSPTPNLQLAMSIACLELRLTPAEALAAVTINAAAAVRKDGELGSLEAGKQADLVVWDVPSVELIPYWLGANLTRLVIKRGEVVFDRGHTADGRGPLERRGASGAPSR